MFVALIVFSFPHGFLAARNIRKRSEVQHISPLILSSSHLCLICHTGVEGARASGGKRKREGPKEAASENET